MRACEPKNTRDGNSGGTIASALGIFEQAWSGGTKITKKLNGPLLLASSGALGKVGGPGGLGYDPIAKCEGVMTRKCLFFFCLFVLLVCLHLGTRSKFVAVPLLKQK